jgi:hypothetical protein
LAAGDPGRERLLGHEGQQAEPLVLVDAVGSRGGHLEILAQGAECLPERSGGPGVAVGGDSEGAGAVGVRAVWTALRHEVAERTDELLPA